MKRRYFLCSALAAFTTPTLAEIAPFSALTDYERASGGRIGLYAENLRTGKRIAWRAHERFVMCSTFKASLVGCVLRGVDHGKTRLNEPIAYGPDDLMEYAPVARQNLEKRAMSVSAMCEAVVEWSDNTCANSLLAHIGGPPALTAFWRSIGDEVTRLDHNEPQLNRSPPGDPHDTTTPTAMAHILQSLTLGTVLSPESRERLTGWMIGCKTGDNRLRAGLPTTWQIADKTGNNGKDAAGDIAIAWPAHDDPVVICTYTQGGTPTPAQVDAVFAKIGHFVGIQL